MLNQTSSWTKMSFIAGTVLFVIVLCPSNVVSQEHRYTRCKWNVTKYGCPKFGDDSWRCLKGESRCPSNTEYHCARLSWNTNTFGDGCYENITCKEGEAPFIFNDWEIRCDWCSNPDRYNSEQRVSSTYSECEQKKVKCHVPNGIECEPAQETDKYKQNRRCRCDARRNYVMPDLEEYGKGEICTSDPFLAPQCQPAVPCGNNQERLLNYTCADKCINGYRPDDSDDCIPRIVTTSTTDISPPENSTKEPSSTPSSSSLTTTLSSTLTTSKQSSFPVPKSTTAHNLVLNPTDNSYKGPSDTVLFVVIGVLGAAVLVLLAIVIYYKCTKRKNGSGRQSNNNGDALLLEDTKAAKKDKESESNDGTDEENNEEDDEGT